IFNYLPTYLSKSLNFAASTSFIITSIGLAMLCLSIPFAGMAADKLGRRKVLLSSALLMALLTYPAYLLMQNGSIAWAIGGIILLAVLFSGQAGVIHTSLLELFPVSVRTTGYSFGYNIGLAIFGGAGPLIVTSIIASTGNQDVPAYYVIGAALCTFLSALVITESKARSLHD
ncbi:proline/betaine transporter ProP, partial [Arthrobacter crystallopoietes BAB-32]